ncbi:MAG: AMP-binding protein [Bacteroidaceae bacterium]|nr:AMP-binding protein [Bacteroidaceae bacterium]
MKLFKILIKLHIVTPRGIFRLAQSFVKEGITLMALMRFAAKYYPGKTAIVSESDRLTYKQLYAKALRLSNILNQRFSIQKSDNVAVLCRNHTVSALLLPSLQRLGANTKFINTDYAEQNIRDIISRKKFKLLIFDEDFEQKIPTEFRYLSVSTETLAEMLKNTACAPSPLPRPPFFKSPQISVLIGGTSGSYKEASRKPSVFQFLPPFFALLRDIEIHKYQSVMIVLPFYHGFGLCTLIISLLMGKKVCLARYFDANVTMQTIINERVEVLPAVPVMLSRMWQKIGSGNNRDIEKNLKCIVCGGDRLSKKLINETEKILGSVIYNLYGTSEAGFFMLATPNDLSINPEPTIGKPLSGIRCKIENRDSQGIGTLWVRSPWAATSLRNRWQSTGDRVSVNAEGYFFYHGRADRMAVCGGENVYPEDVEKALCEHQSVVAAKAFAVPDKDFGTVLNAKIELENDADICCNDITEWLKIRIPRAAMPHRVEFGRLTTTSTGKICNRQK